MADLVKYFQNLFFFGTFITVCQNVERVIMVCHCYFPIIIIIYFQISKWQTWSNGFKIRQKCLPVLPERPPRPPLWA